MVGKQDYESTASTIMDLDYDEEVEVASVVFTSDTNETRMNTGIVFEHVSHNHHWILHLTYFLETGRQFHHERGRGPRS